MILIAFCGLNGSPTRKGPGQGTPDQRRDECGHRAQQGKRQTPGSAPVATIE